MNIAYAFIKELNEDTLYINVNSNDIEIKVTKEDTQLILNAIEQGTYIIPFDLESKEIVTDVVGTQQLLKQFPETYSDELMDADTLPAELI